MEETSGNVASNRAGAAMRRGALTVLVPIQPERLAALEGVLEEMGRDIQGNPYVPFQRLRTTHFLRWVIVPGACGEDSGPEGPSLLAFEANFDETAGDFLEDLIRVAGKALRERVYCHCAPPVPRDSDEALEDYLLDHARGECLFFPAYPDLTVASIDNNARVHELITRFLDEHPEAPARSASGLREDLRRHLEGVRAADMAREAGPVLELDPGKRPWKERLRKTRLVRYALGALVLPVAIPTGLAMLGLELAEWVAEKVRSRKSGPVRPLYRGEDVKKLGEMLDREDFQAQNPLTHLADLKPGALRRLLLELAFRVWGHLATHYFTGGRLGGIEGIHFARWVLLEDEVRGTAGPRKKYRLLFFSNYDGSWEGYLGSFVDRASLGLTTIWCNTEGFPRTRLRLWPPRLELGAKREEAFKQWVRQHQLATQAWFSRHPDKSVSNIANDREIRSKVGARLSRKQVRDWLLRL